MCVTEERFGLSAGMTGSKPNQTTLWSSITKQPTEKRSYDYSTAALRT